MRRWLAFLILAVTTAAFGAVPKVPIGGKVIAPDGLTYSGTINCVLSAPATALDGATSVRVQSTGTLTIASDGTVTGSLVANDITTPVTSYTCTTRINRVPVYTQSELIYLTSAASVDWGAISRPGATPYTPVGVAGSLGAVQASNGSGGLADSGVTATAGALTATSVNGEQFWPLATALTGTIAAGTYDFGEGTYTITGAVTLSSGVHLRGRGPGKTILQLAADRTGGAVFSVNAGSTDVSNITIEDMTIDGNDATWASSYLLYVTSGATSQLTDATFRNVTFKGIKSRALVLTSAARVKVIGCTFNGVGATNPNGTAIYGIYVGQAAKKASSDITIEHNTFTNFGGAAIQPGTASAGITIVTPASGVRINDNHFSNFVAANNYKLDAIELNGVTTDMPRQVTVSNNTFSAIKGSMVNAEASGGSSNCNAFNTDMGLIVEGNTGADVGYDDTAVHKPGIYICNAKNVVIKGNAISDTAGDGNGTIEVHTTGGTVSENIITYTVAAASPASVPLYLGGADIICTDNEVRGGTYGIQVQSLTNSRIEQNVLSDQLTYPMFINPVGSGDVSGVVVRNNKLSSSLGSIAHAVYTNGNITNSEFSHNTSAGFSTATVYLSGGASSNAFEFNRNATTINGTLVKSSTDLKSMPDASGTVVLDRDNGPGAVAALRSHLSAYGDPSFSERPAFVDMYVDFFHGQPLMTDFSGGASGYKDPVFTVAQCPANTPSSGSCTDTTGIDYVCISDPNGDGTAGNDISVGDGIVFIGTAASSALGTPTGQTYYVTAIGAGGGAGTDCPNTGNNKKVTLRPRPNYVSEGIVSGTTKLTTVWHQAYHWGYAASYLAGYQLAFASRDTYGAHGRNLISNGVLNGNTGKTPPGWTATNFTLGYQQFQTTPTVASTTQCFEGEAGTAPYACVNDATCASGGFLETGWIDVEPGARYVADGFLTAYATDAVGLYSDKNEDGTYEALTGNTTWAFDGLLFNRHWGVPTSWTRSYTIPWDVQRVKFRYVSGASCSSGTPTLDGWSLRRLTTRQADGEVAAYAGGTTYAAGTSVSYGGQVWTSTLSSNVGHQPDVSPTWWSPTGGRFLIEDPGTRNIVYTGDSWSQNDGTNFSNGKKFCDGLKAGMQARLGRDISSQIVCNGRGGETTAQLLSGTACTTQLSTGGALNCWNDQIAQYSPLYTIVILGTNDVIGSVTSATYVGNMKQISRRLQSIGSAPIFLSPAPIENSFGSYAYMASAHAYYTLLKHAVLDEVP